MARTRAPGRLPDREQRSGRASFAALLYAALLLGAPGLHLLSHRGDHDHVGGGLRLRAALLAEHPHEHDHPHPGTAPRAGTPPAPVQREAPRPPPAHGDGSLVHFAVGLLPAAALPAVPLVGLLPVTALCPAPPGRAPAPLVHAPPPARGPPATRCT